MQQDARAVADALRKNAAGWSSNGIEHLFGLQKRVHGVICKKKRCWCIEVLAYEIAVVVL